jgi:RNA polymerase sigma-70 factor (ECF subfamily)
VSANTTEQSDEQIVTQILRGVDLFEVLYLRYYLKAYRFVYGMTGEQETAQDLTQEIFVKVFRQLATFRAESRFSTWFYKIARNHCLNYFRQSIDDIDENQIHHLREVVSADALILKREIQYHVRQALRCLPPTSREWLVLADIIGLSYQELAEHFDCPVGTVGSTLSRARERLASKLEYLKGQI